MIDARRRNRIEHAAAKLTDTELVSQLMERCPELNQFLTVFDPWKDGRR